MSFKKFFGKLICGLKGHDWKYRCYRGIPKVGRKKSQMLPVGDVCGRCGAWGDLTPGEEFIETRKRMMRRSKRK